MPLVSHSIRDDLLDFLTRNPTAWRVNTLAKSMGVNVKRLGIELAQLSAEGKVVSCTVTVTDKAPQLEYRLAASAITSKASQFVISRETNVRFR